MKCGICTVCLVPGLILAAGAATALAGPVDPPAGPVTSTMKTLDQVEPRTAINATNTPGDADSMYRITAPGSYYLSGNIQGVTGKSGIEIATDSVTLDLNGFTILGAAGSLAGVSGESRNNIAIVNGGVRGWGGDGIDLFSAYECRIADVTLQYNGGDGLRIGRQASIDRVIARGNGGTGIQASSYSVLTACIASVNFDGIDPGPHSIARDCEASGNNDDGFDCVGTEPVLDNCTASSNGGDGFVVASHARVEQCVASFNTGHGIVFGSESSILRNHCDTNGVNGVGAGLYGGSGTSRARIEGNTCTSSDYGIKLDGPSNLTIGNRCSVNGSNFEIVSGNRVGAIVVLPTSGASGNSGGNSGAADPVSNLAF